MSIDLLPFNAFALESCAAPANGAGEGHTLTLSLRLPRHPEAMTGRLSLQPLNVVVPDAQRVGIVRNSDAPLTISFGY